MRDDSLTGHPRASSSTANVWKTDLPFHSSPQGAVLKAATQHRPRSAVRSDERISVIATQDGRWSLSPVSSDGPMDTSLSPGMIPGQVNLCEYSKTPSNMGGIFLNISSFYELGENF